MSILKFLAHVNESEARFLCVPAGGGRKKPIEVPLVHEAGAPATPKKLAKLKQLLGRHAREVEELYAAHDGFNLYVQPPAEMGLQFYPIGQWEKATKQFRKEFEDWGRPLDEASEWERKGVVFGEPPSSGNKLVLYAGKVYYWDHDASHPRPFAPSFSKLLGRIAKEPAKLLFDLGCYARYSDGRTHTQWIPEKYLSRERGS